MPLKTWIFQATPKTFDIEGFLRTLPHDFLWLVTSGSDAMDVGDRVFLWQAIGGGSPRDSGVVAEAEILEKPAVQPEDRTALPFWRPSSPADDPLQPANRVRLKLRRVAGKRQIIRRDWLINVDPVLRELTILKRAAGTNFSVPAAQAERLDALWTKTGTDWTYPDSVAGLWAYHQTYGGELSRSVGSPVSEIALLIGRAVSGVYNKVMNFRNLDPRDDRSGFSGGGATDASVWAKFYDASSQTLHADELEAEFRRLWKPAVAAPVLGSDDAATEQYEQQVSTLVALPLEALMDRYNRSRDVASTLPKSSIVSGRRFERDPLLSALAKVRAKFRCEVSNCTHPTFVGKDGQPYMEVHHITPLAQGGADMIDNVACICPAHHREAHVGKRAKDIAAGLVAVRFSAGSA